MSSYFHEDKQALAAVGGMAGVREAVHADSQVLQMRFRPEGMCVVGARGDGALTRGRADRNGKIKVSALSISN